MQAPGHSKTFRNLAVHENFSACAACERGEDFDCLVDVRRSVYRSSTWSCSGLKL